MKRRRSLSGGELRAHGAARQHFLLRPDLVETARRRCRGRIHPTSCFYFVAEYFQRPAPNGIGARMLKLAREFSGRSRVVRVSHSSNLGPVPLTTSLSTPKLFRNAGGKVFPSVGWLAGRSEIDA